MNKLRIYLSKSNKCLPEFLCNVRDILQKHGDVVEFFTGNWKDHEPVLDICDMFVIVGYPQMPTQDNAFLVGKGQYTSLEKFCRTFSGKWHGSVIYAVENPETGQITFCEVTDYSLNDSENWTMKFGKLEVGGEDHYFSIFAVDLPVRDPDYKEPEKSVFV